MALFFASAAPRMPRDSLLLERRR